MKPDDGLIAPAGYEIERWPDSSPKMVDIRFCDNEQHWINQCGVLWAGHGDIAISATGYYRVALKKLPERKLLNFREAVAAHHYGKVVRSVSRTTFRWDAFVCSPRMGETTGIYDWMFDATDFYVEEPT